MQAHRERRALAGDEDGLVRRRPGDHEARRGEDSVVVRLRDGAVDAAGKSEIVAGDDELLQAWSSRAVMKRRNSAPSRRRRFIIPVLEIISHAISAIFAGRK